MQITTYGPPKQCGGIRVIRMFSTSHAGTLGAWSLGRYICAGLSCGHSRHSLLKGGNNLLGPSKSRDTDLRLHIDLEQFEDEATP